MSYEDWEPYYEQYGLMLVGLLKHIYDTYPEPTISTMELRQHISPRIQKDHPELSPNEVEDVFIKLILWLPMNGYAIADTVDGVPTLSYRVPTPEVKKKWFGKKQNKSLDV